MVIIFDTGELLLFIGLFLIVLAVIGWFFEPPYDDTDPQGKRSGLRLLVDNRTGCHYLGSPQGGITPRLDAKGNHICDSRK